MRVAFAVLFAALALALAGCTYVVDSADPEPVDVTLSLDRGRRSGGGGGEPAPTNGGISAPSTSPSFSPSLFLSRTRARDGEESARRVAAGAGREGVRRKK